MVTKVTNPLLRPAANPAAGEVYQIPSHQIVGQLLTDHGGDIIPMG